MTVLAAGAMASCGHFGLRHGTGGSSVWALPAAGGDKDADEF